MHTIKLPLHNSLHACQRSNRQHSPKRHCNSFTKDDPKKSSRVLKTPVRNFDPDR